MRRLGRLMMLAGLAVCLVNGVLAARNAFINLPPEVMRALAIAFPFVVGGGLIASGAVIVRLANRDRWRSRRYDGSPTATPSPREIGAGSPIATGTRPSRSEPVRDDRV